MNLKPGYHHHWHQWSRKKKMEMLKKKKVENGCILQKKRKKKYSFGHNNKILISGFLRKKDIKNHVSHDRLHLTKYSISMGIFFHHGLWQQRQQHSKASVCRQDQHPGLLTAIAQGEQISGGNRNE